MYTLQPQIAYTCYVHEMQAGRNLLIYLNYILTDFEKNRIKTGIILQFYYC